MIPYNVLRDFFQEAQDSVEIPFVISDFDIGQDRPCYPYATYKVLTNSHRDRVSQERIFEAVSNDETKISTCKVSKAVVSVSFLTDQRIRAAYDLGQSFVDFIEDNFFDSIGVVVTPQSQEVEDRIVKKLDCYITIHPDPINSDHPLYNQLKKSIQEIVSADNQLVAYHDLRIVGGKKKFTAIFDITSNCKRDAHSINNIKRRVRTKLQREFPRAKFRIKLEPVFAY